MHRDIRRTEPHRMFKVDAEKRPQKQAGYNFVARGFRDRILTDIDRLDSLIHYIASTYAASPFQTAPGKANRRSTIGAQPKARW